MKATAAICTGPDHGFTIDTVEVDEPRGTEVLVRITATGMCHTDLSVKAGIIPFGTPSILGHEGAGVVEAVGPNVSGLAVGDSVLMMSPSCGSCAQCDIGHPALCEVRELRWTGKRLDGTHTATLDGRGIGTRFLGQSSFSSYTLVEQRTVVPVSSAVSPSVLAPIGCGVVTGAGAVLNVLRPAAGASIAVIGAGTVGLSAVMAARLTTASTVIVADRVPARLELADRLGADQQVQAGPDLHLDEALLELTGGKGVDCIVDTTGNVGVLEQLARSLAVAGTLAFVGAGANTTVPVPVIPFISGARGIRGVCMGDGTVPFLRALIDHHLAGRLPVDELVTEYPFEEIERAATDSESGATVKPVLTFAG